MEATYSDPKRLAHQRQLARQKRDRQRKNPLDYAPGIELLSAIGRYHYLTVDQVQRLTCWSSKPFIWTWLKHLSTAGYVYDKNFIADSLGRPSGVWSLLPKGRQALKDRDLPVMIRIPSDNRRDSSWLAHVRDLNDVLIQFERLTTSEPSWTISGFRHDLELQRVATPLLLPGGEKHYFVPDGWVVLDRADSEFAFCIEMDRGTEREKGAPWREKVRSYLAFVGDPYRQLFDREHLSGVLVAVRSHHETDQRRLQNLIRWTEQELTVLNKERWGSFFRFTTLHADQVTPQEFFYSESWSQPFSDRKEALLL